MFEHVKVGFIGAGNMGEALIKGLLGASVLASHQINAYDVSASRRAFIEKEYGVVPSSDAAEVAAESQVIVLAVKPQNMPEVLAAIRSRLSHGPLIISIAAGISLASLSQGLPEKIPTVRVMPNTPALVLEGASALARGPNVTDDHMKMALTLFRSVGMAMEVDEKWMDTVTGLSGSGPAYVLLVLESLIDAGVLMGLPRPIARDLVIQTVRGTAEMLRETGKHPGELKDLITSPGGTTIAGLQILEERSVRGALMRAVEAATLRSRELGKNK